MAKVTYGCNHVTKSKRVKEKPFCKSSLMVQINVLQVSLFIYLLKTFSI